jgi:hypothetical protein
VNKGLLTTRPVTRSLTVFRYFMVVFSVAQGIVVWWQPLPKWYVSGLCLTVAMFWGSMIIISCEISKGRAK